MFLFDFDITTHLCIKGDTISFTKKALNIEIMKLDKRYDCLLF